jgi:hypothetical protein
VCNWILFNWIVADLVDDNAEKKDLLSNVDTVYNVVGLISALLLSLGITPFVSLGDWHDRFGSSPAFVTFALALMFMMGVLFLNLIIILVCMTYLHSVASRPGVTPLDVKDRAYSLPVFGIPICLFTWGVWSCLVWLLAWIFLFLPAWYAYTIIAVGIIPTIVFFGFLGAWVVHRVQKGLPRPSAVPNLPAAAVRPGWQSQTMVTRIAGGTGRHNVHTP